MKFGVSEISNPKITSIIQEYIESNQDGIPKVYTMVVHRKDILNTSISICTLTTYDELYKLIPSGYFKVNDNVVLVYTGLEHLEKPDSTFMKELEKTVGTESRITCLRTERQWILIMRQEYMILMLGKLR